MIRFLFDGIEVANPSNWQDIESALKLDEVLNAVLLVEDTSLTFVDSAFDYITEKELDGFCTTIDVTIQDSCGGDVYTDIVVGTIFISDLIIDERRCTATVKIRDKSFFSAINNNKSIELIPTTNQSKNLLPITAASLYNLDVYGLNNVLLTANVPSYRIYELLRVAVDFMTDSRVGFASSLFDIGGDFEGLCITNGYMLRTATVGEMTATTFEKLIRELRSKIPIKFAVENPYTTPVLRLELESYFEASTTVFEIENINEILRKYETNKLYARIDIGSSATDDDLTLSFPENIRYVGFREESFTVIGQCNVDNTLSLQGDWVVSSNVIEKITTTGDQNYDNQIIMFNSVLTDALNGRTENSNFLNLNPATYYYNESLTNQSVFNRYVGLIPNSIAAVAGAKGDGIFTAYVASPYAFGTGFITNTSVNTTNVQVNVGGYFDGTDKFTAAVTGAYDITMFIELDILTMTGTNPIADVFLSINQYDSANNLIFTYSLSPPYAYTTTGLNSKEYTQRVILNQGDYITFVFAKNDRIGTLSTGEITVNTYWKCDENTVGGGIYKEYDYMDFPVNVFEFEYPLTATQWGELIADPKQKIAFSQAGQRVRSAYIKNVSRNHVTGVTSFTLINTPRQYAY